MVSNDKKNTDIEALRSRIQANFDRSGLLIHMNASLGEVVPGRVHIHLPYSSSVTQHLGYFHAGATTTIADAAGGFAGITLAPANHTVLSIEFKTNLLAPGQGESLEAIGKVIRAGRTITVTQVDVYALKAGEKKQIAIMQQTLINVPKAGR